MAVSRYKRNKQKQLMENHWWWHSGMLMILMSAVILITTSNTASANAVPGAELNQLIIIDAFNYTLKDTESILQDPDSFRLNYTKSYLYLNTDSTIQNILLQCKETKPELLSLLKTKWMVNGIIQNDESQTLVVNREQQSGVTEVSCYGSGSRSGAIAAAFFYIVISEPVSEISENSSRSDDVGVELQIQEGLRSHESYTKELSLLFKSQNDNHEISSVANYIYEGHPITLHCELTPSKSDIKENSDTQVQFEFFKNGKLINKDDEEEVYYHYSFQEENMWKQTLTIPSISPEDAGVFSCKAKLLRPEITTPVFLYSDLVLDVKSKPKIIDFPGASQMFKNATDGLYLNCTIESDLSDANVFWKLNGSRLSCEGDNDGFCQMKVINSTSSDASTISLSSSLVVSQVLSSGNYSCIAENEVGNVEETIEISSISERPKIISDIPNRLIRLLNSRIDIPCSTSGIPLPAVTWWKRENLGELKEVVAGTEGIAKLSIPSLNEEEEGEYECVAKDIYGHEDRRIITIVGVKPSMLPVDVQKSTNVTINAGESQTFYCNATIDENILKEAKRTWFKDSNHLEVTNNPTFHNIPYGNTYNHQGQYRCVIETPIDELEIIWNLKVKSSEPKLIKYMNEKVVKSIQGGNISLSCDVSAGLPTPRIEWKKNGTPMNIDESTLLLSQLSSEDQGIYTCSATNEYGSDLIESVVEVLNHTSFKKKPTDTFIESQKTAIFDCVPDADERMNVSSSEIMIEWFKDNVNLNRNGTPLILENVSNFTEGHYECRITTPYDSIRAAWRLIVKGEKPFFISTDPHERTLEGKNVSISCQANGLPLPTISWTRDNLDVVSDRTQQETLGDLTITNVKVEDEGVYICAAENMYGKITTRTNFEVIRKLDKNTVGYNKSSDVTANYKESVVLSCDFSPDPRIKDEVKIGWSRINDRNEKNSIQFNEIKYQRGEEGSLVIHDLSEKDMGIYECVFETPLQQVNEQISLIVEGKAPVIISSMKPIYAMENTPINIVCKVSGVPQPMISWSSDDMFLGPPLVKGEEYENEIIESRVDIKKIKKNQAGVYKCTATNNYGSREKSSKVYVMDKSTVEISQGGYARVRAGERLTLPCKYKGMNITLPSNLIT